MKDKPYNQTMQDKLNEAEDLYFANIRHNKDLVWERIEERLKKKKIIPLWIYYAAASFLLLISLGIVFKYKLDAKNLEIADLKDSLKSREAQKIAFSIQENTKIKSDTVIIVNEKIVNMPVIQTETHIVHDTVNQIVVKSDTVFIQSSQPEKPVESNLLAKEENSNIQIIETNTHPKKKKRNARFIFQFGKPKPENPVIEPQSLITLQTK